MDIIWILVAMPLLSGIYSIYVARKNVIEREQEHRYVEGLEERRSPGKRPLQQNGGKPHAGGGAW